ncbi:protein tyrosine phosphatase family protein [Botrimarina sp.]|uniref:protein tyrosine phosphatase family protein n=1 Tax=Botrimarina sp. TaxID=2795802 RepID=UPI0032EC4BB3
MPGRMKINDEITVAPQPSEEEIAKLADEGFRSVVNFRTENEDDQPLSPFAERDLVEEAGLTYLHCPISMQTMGPATIDEFRERFDDLPKPVFAHCKLGKRAGAMVMMDIAVKQGMSGQETLDKADEMGFECDQPELRDVVKNYVDNHHQ